MIRKLDLMIGLVLALVISSVVGERRRRDDLARVRAMQPRCVGDARAEGIRF